MAIDEGLRPAHDTGFGNTTDATMPYHDPSQPSVTRHIILTKPKELDRIFTYLPLNDLLSCRQVCKIWKQTIIGSRSWKEKLYLAPAPNNSQQPLLNPLLTSISGKVSHLHPIHNHISPLLRQDHNLILSWKGRYYRPEMFFNRASNPSTTDHNIIEWQLRSLSRSEICELDRGAIFPGPEAKFWRMYLCQPPPLEVRITVWEMGDACGHVTERFVIKAWTVREIFERMDEARREDRRGREAVIGKERALLKKVQRKQH